MTTFDDEERLRALSDYRVLDTPPEQVFDNLTRMATEIFRVPIALVSLVDEERQWFKSRVGLDVSETPRAHAFCDHAIRGDGPMVVKDATGDPRFVDNPLVTGEPGIRFYAGVPLRTPEGHGLGTLCLIDRVPRDLDPGKLRLLERLADQARIELEIRRRLAMLEERLSAQREHQRSRELLASMVVHDLRSPLSAVISLASTIDAGDDGSREALDDLLTEAERMRHMLTDVLDVCLEEVGELRLRPVRLELRELVERVARRFRRQAGLRGQSLLLELPGDPIPLTADLHLVERVVVNLVGNALDHGPPGRAVTVAARAEGGRARIEVRDEGAPIPEEARERIFQPFQRLDAAAFRRGHGLGLAFCRLATAAHGGSVRIAPSANGNVFDVDLPLTPSPAT